MTMLSQLQRLDRTMIEKLSSPSILRESPCKVESETISALKDLDIDIEKDDTTTQDLRDFMANITDQEVQIFASSADGRPEFWPIPLQYTVDSYTVWQEVFAENPGQAKWPKGYLPIFSNGGGVEMVIDLDSASKSYGALFEYDHEIQGIFKPVAPSLLDLVSNTADAVEKGHLVKD